MLFAHVLFAVGCASSKPTLTPAVPDESRSDPPRAAPRVVPKGTSDDELLEAADWTLEGLPAISRDGRRVATVFWASSGYRAIVDEAEPNFDEPNGIEEYPNWLFVVADAATGAIERSERLIDAAELDAAQRQRSKSALAEAVRRRLAVMDRVLADGGYRGMPSVRLDGRQRVDVHGVKVRVTAGRLSVEDAAGRRRLDVTLDEWRGRPLPMSPGGFTCLYTPRLEELAIEAARGIVVVLVAQETNGGDACAGADNADRQLKVLRLAP